MLVSVECAPSWLTLKDFSREYSTSRTQAWREMAAGRLVAHKFGKRVLISRVNADQWASSFPRFESRLKSAKDVPSVRMASRICAKYSGIPK